MRFYIQKLHDIIYLCIINVSQCRDNSHCVFLVGCFFILFSCNIFSLWNRCTSDVNEAHQPIRRKHVGIINAANVPFVRTPLHCAASCNSVHLCKMLVESGAAIFATTISDVETAADKCEEMEEGYTHCSQFLYGDLLFSSIHLFWRQETLT